MSYLPSIIVLGLLAIVAWRQAVTRHCAENTGPERQAAATMLLIATSVQAVHFVEEAARGFHVAFPAVFGQAPVPFAVFLLFNLTWLVIWFASVPGVSSGRTAALFAAWFLALAGMLNGVAHPLLAAVVGGYFPGLATSPLIGIAGVFLWQRLRQATREAPGTSVAE